jgi:transcriptional regulator with XRE-family HTH domain
MSLNSLQLDGFTHMLLGVPSLQDIRVALRSARRELKKERGLTLDRLHERSGIDRAVIHRIESVEKYPTYEPGVDTVRRLVEGMGLTLSEFFARIEALPTRDVSDTLPPPAPIPQGKHGNTDPVSRPLDDTGAIIARNTAALDELIEAVRLVSGELRATREQNAGARTRKSAKAARSREAR